MLNAWSFWNNHMGGLQGRVKQQAKSKGWIEQAPASTRPWEGSGVIGVSNCVSLPAFLSSERDCTLGQEWAKSNFFFFFSATNSNKQASPPLSSCQTEVSIH